MSIIYNEKLNRHIDTDLMDDDEIKSLEPDLNEALKEYKRITDKLVGVMACAIDKISDNQDIYNNIHNTAIDMKLVLEDINKLK